MNDYLLIEGVTEEGRRFRPSDWIDRLASAAATFGTDRRLRFSEQLRPMVVEGNRVLGVALSLQSANPGVWRQVMEFARSNRLRVQWPADPHSMLALAS